MACLTFYPILVLLKYRENFRFEPDRIHFGSSRGFVYKSYKVFAPPFQSASRGPETSECTTSRILQLGAVKTFGISVRQSLPAVQSSHVMGFCVLEKELIPTTARLSLSSSNVSALRWPSLFCHVSKDTESAEFYAD